MECKKVTINYNTWTFKSVSQNLNKIMKASITRDGADHWHVMYILLEEITQHIWQVFAAASTNSKIYVIDLRIVKEKHDFAKPTVKLKALEIKIGWCIYLKGLQNVLCFLLKPL